MINQDNNLILIKGEDKTSSIVSWRFDNYKPIVYITYKQGKSYTYNAHDVKFLKNPHVVTLDNCIAFKDDSPISGVAYLQFFENYCRVVYKSGYREIVKSARIKVVESALKSSKSKNCFEYLKQLAMIIGLVVDGHNILAKHYEKIDFVRDDSVLAAFLSGKYSHASSSRIRS